MKICSCHSSDSTVRARPRETQRERERETERESKEYIRLTSERQFDCRLGTSAMSELTTLHSTM